MDTNNILDTDNILYYTDGHQVTITDAGLKVKKTVYRLNGISRHGLSIITPPRVPIATLIVLGSCLFIAGAMNLIPASWNTYVQIFGFSLLVNSLFMGGGIILLLAGLLIMLKLREKYAVRILTAEGEKNVVVSGSREYISQIVNALNRAFLDLVKSPKEGQKVSHT
jgi:hypothetical protein